MTIVDTPGIGENDHLTDVLLTYLPNAVAFIYVINASNSGGIQDDYVSNDGIYYHHVYIWNTILITKLTSTHTIKYGTLYLT